MVDNLKSLITTSSWIWKHK